VCGIVAQLGRTDEFAEAVRLTEHRGIRTRVHESGWGRIAHARLPIVGVDEANDQPVCADKWTIAFVGEVLDFKETQVGNWEDCDLHTVVRNWVERGASGMRDHDGFWAIVALDESSGVLHCVVDYLAQKPMYYRIDVGAIASEPSAAAALGPTTPDEIYFAAVAKWGYCPETWRTPYSEVQKMLPGQYITMRRGFGYVDFDEDFVDYLTPRAILGGGELKREIELAVERRVLRSDVPVAILYSGGLDSSIVRCVAERYTGKLNYYSVPDACDIPDLSDVPLVSLGYCSGVSAADVVHYMQEPVDLGSVVPQIAMSKVVRERVCLTGDGADELFGGYSRAQRYDSQWSDVFHELVSYHLPRLDRVMMRNRVEVRSPFLARRVVEIALGLPYDLRKNKQILRDLFRDDLPAGRADVPKVPLRTREVEQDRESHTLDLIAEFRRRAWPSA